jgi:hypothetical protein
MNCPICSTRMDYDTRNYDTVMAGKECPNQCARRREEIQEMAGIMLDETFGTPEWSKAFERVKVLVEEDKRVTG